jgi:hypothetical protein
VLQANAGGEPRWFVDALLDAFDAVNAARIAAQDDLRQGRIGWSGFNRRRAVYNAEHRARREWLWTRRFGVAPPRRA